jgi:hypothetical protein
MIKTMATPTEEARRTVEAWTLGWPGPILNHRAHTLEPLEILNKCRHHQ